MQPGLLEWNVSSGPQADSINLALVAQGMVSILDYFEFNLTMIHRCAQLGCGPCCRGASMCPLLISKI